jgi:hypothetical protein
MRQYDIRFAVRRKQGARKGSLPADLTPQPTGAETSGPRPGAAARPLPPAWGPRPPGSLRDSARDRRCAAAFGTCSRRQLPAQRTSLRLPGRPPARCATRREQRAVLGSSASWRKRRMAPFFAAARTRSTTLGGPRRQGEMEARFRWSCTEGARETPPRKQASAGKRPRPSDGAGATLAGPPLLASALLCLAPPGGAARRGGDALRAEARKVYDRSGLGLEGSPPQARQRSPTGTQGMRQKAKTPALSTGLLLARAVPELSCRHQQRRAAAPRRRSVLGGGHLTRKRCLR